MTKLFNRNTAFISFAMLVATPAGAEDYPVIPEPMIFDMMRPLGARRGEVEVNTLAQAPLSGDGPIQWAPELEYTYADGLAVEFELPFTGMRLAELKLGLQAAFGTLNGGKSAHGVQYLGIYDRHGRSYSSTAAYMFGHRFNSRLSSMTMIGLGEIDLAKRQRHNAFILNHAVFLNVGLETVAGIEVNWKGGSEGSLLIMP